MKKYLLLLLSTLFINMSLFADDEKPHVVFLLDGKDVIGHVCIWDLDNKREFSEQAAPYLEPGHYKACCIRYEYNDEDRSYVVAPSVEFTYTTGTLTVNLTSASDDDYVEVPLRLLNRGTQFSELGGMNVKIIYDGVFPITEELNGNAYSYTTRHPLKMLKGSYDYQASYFWKAFVYGLNGHVDVKDDTSTFDVDLKDMHYFEKIEALDKNGNAIDWTAEHLYPYLTLVDDNGNTYFGMELPNIYGLTLPYGEYNIVFVAEKEYGEAKPHLTGNAQSITETQSDNDSKLYFPAKLTVNAESGDIARIQVDYVSTGIANTEVTNHELNATPVSGGIRINGNSSDDIKVAVYTTSGTCMLSTSVRTGETLNLSHLSPAAYIVRLEQNGQTATQKFVK